MAKVPFVVNDAVGAICESLQMSYNYDQGHYWWASEEDFYSAYYDAEDYLNRLFEGGDLSVAGQLDALASADSFYILYWSTEGQYWY